MGFLHLEECLLLFRPLVSLFALIDHADNWISRFRIYKTNIILVLFAIKNYALRVDRPTIKSRRFLQSLSLSLSH